MGPKATRKRPADTSCDSSIPSKINAAEASQMTSAEAKQLGEQLKELETRINQKLVDIGGSIQAGLDAMKETVFTSKGSRQGHLRASFNVNNLDKRCYSGSIRISGSTYSFYVSKSTEDKENISLAVGLQCKRDSDALIYDVDYTVRLPRAIVPYCRSGHNCFDGIYPSRCWSSFILWSELTDSAKGFIDKDGNFMMQAEILVCARMNAQVPLNLDYSASSFVEPDCTLVVEGQKIPVCKGLMMAYSNHFKTMFFSGFFARKMRID